LSRVTPEFAKWLLWNEKKLRASIVPGAPVCTFMAIVTMHDGGSQVERAAIKRESILSVLSALDRAYNAMHPEHKKLYRYRFREGMSYNKIARKMDISPDSIGRRIAEMTDIIAAFLELVPDAEYREFSRFVDANL